MGQQTETLESPNTRQAVLARFVKIFWQYFWWLFMNVVGFGVCPWLSLIFWASFSYPILLLNNIFGNNLPESLQCISCSIFSISFFLMFFLFGALIGLCQWFSLGVRKPRLIFWLLLDGLVWVPFPLLIYSFSLLPFLSLLEASVLLGLLMGILQGIVQSILMYKVNRRAWWWLLATVIGFTLGFLVFGNLAMQIQQDASITGVYSTGYDGAVSGYLLSIPILGFVYSAISGLFLIWPIRWFETPTAIAPKTVNKIAE
jgi:hypothetical protein